MSEQTSKSDLLVQKFFEGTNLVGSDIASFNNFIDKELQRIVDSLAQEYEVDRISLADDAERFVQMLVDRSLIHRSGP